jgi:hypothetical protein
MDWIQLAQNRDHWLALMNMVMNLWFPPLDHVLRQMHEVHNFPPYFPKIQSYIPIYAKDFCVVSSFQVFETKFCSFQILWQTQARLSVGDSERSFCIYSVQVIYWWTLIIMQWAGIAQSV